MKTSLKTAFAAAAVSALVLSPLAAVHAQETAVKTTTAVSADGTAVSASTTTSEGTIQEFTPGASRIIVKSSTGPATYNYSKKTTFVDAAGNVVSSETIKAGEPTTVYYTMEAGQPVVSKVVVNRTVAPAASSTTVHTVAPAAPVTKTESSETTTTTTTRH